MAVKTLIDYLGEDPDRPGLAETPKRVVKAYDEMFSGYFDDPRIKTFDTESIEYNEMIVCRNIEFYSFCEHHMLPFFGTAHIGYIPSKDRIIGLSKLARILDVYAKRLQVQERLTYQIAEALNEALDPLGVAVAIEAKHFCMVCRGVRKQRSSMITSKLTGEFLSEARVRQEFFSLCNING